MNHIKTYMLIKCIWYYVNVSMATTRVAIHHLITFTHTHCQCWSSVCLHHELLVRESQLMPVWTKFPSIKIQHLFYLCNILTRFFWKRDINMFGAIRLWQYGYFSYQILAERFNNLTWAAPLQWFFLCYKSNQPQNAIKMSPHIPLSNTVFPKIFLAKDENRSHFDISYWY